MEYVTMNLCKIFKSKLLEGIYGLLVGIIGDELCIEVEEKCIGTK